MTDWRFCGCGHPAFCHHTTPNGTVAWCSVWSPGMCPCTRFQIPTPRKVNVTDAL